MNPKYIVIMPDEDSCCPWSDSVVGCDTWAEAMDLRAQGGIVYEQSPRGPTPTCDLLRAAIKETTDAAMS